MVFESSIAEKWLGQSKSRDAVRDDFDGLAGDGRADDLTKLTKSGLSRLGHSDDVGLDGVVRGLVGWCAIGRQCLFHAGNSTTNEVVRGSRPSTACWVRTT